MKNLILTLLLCFSLFANANEEFKVIEPINFSTFKEAFASIVIKIPKNSSGTMLIIEINNNQYKSILKKEKDVYCKNVSLNIGENIASIILYKNNEIISKKNINIFYTSEIFKEGVDMPSNYKNNNFHQIKKENNCKGCHDMTTDENVSQSKRLSDINLTTEGVVKIESLSNIRILDNPNQSKCFNCHKNLVSRKNSHAPSVNFACTQCHDGSTNSFNDKEENTSRFLAPDPIDIKCMKCHEKIDTSWYKKESKHGPVMSGKCTTCHNPHSSDNEFFLRKPIWKLCTTCHDEKAKGKHVLTSFVFGRNKGAHPTQGRADPARPGRELVCSGCHNPHGSDGIYLLRTEGKTPYSVCKRCHEK